MGERTNVGRQPLVLLAIMIAACGVAASAFVPSAAATPGEGSCFPECTRDPGHEEVPLPPQTPPPSPTPATPSPGTTPAATPADDDLASVPNAFELRIVTPNGAVAIKGPRNDRCDRGTCTYIVARNELVTFEPDEPPTSGVAFAGWSGPCDGSAAPKCVVTMYGNRTIDARFIPRTPSAVGTSRGPLEGKKELTLRVTGAGVVRAEPGAVTCTDVCTRRYEVFDQVVFVASPSPGSEFAGWSGPCQGKGNDTNCALTVNSYEDEVVARFRARAEAHPGGQAGAPAAEDRSEARGNASRPDPATREVEPVEAKASPAPVRPAAEARHGPAAPSSDANRRAAGEPTIATASFRVAFSRNVRWALFRVNVSRPVSADITLLRNGRRLCNVRVRLGRGTGVARVLLPSAVRRGRAFMSIRLTKASGGVVVIGRTVTIPR